MSIEAMKLALASIQDLRGYRPDIDKATEALHTAIQQAEALRTERSTYTPCKSVQKRLAVQPPATSAPAAWLDEMLADTREVFDAGGSETPQVVRDVIEYVKSWVTVYSEKNHQAPAAQPAPSEPATGEPVYWEWRHLGNNQFAADFGQWSEWKRVEARSPIFTAEDELRTLRRYIADGYKYELRALYTRPAPSGLGDSKRLDYLQDRGATIDLIAGVAAFYPMRFRVGGLHSSANIDVRAAIDAAMLTAAKAQEKP